MPILEIVITIFNSFLTRGVFEAPLKSIGEAFVCYYLARVESTKRDQGVEGVRTAVELNVNLETPQKRILKKHNGFPSDRRGETIK